MQDTVVIQSHRSPLPYSWISVCLETVRDWADRNNYAYQWLGDDLFAHVPDAILEKTRDQRVIATDIARLSVLARALENTYRGAVWLDADFLIFDPDNFELPGIPYAVGREVWVQQDARQNLKVYKKVHNAFLMFRRENSFLDFYRDAAERMIYMNHGSMPPQFVGPKLLTAIHNTVHLPVFEKAAMLSPLVVLDLLKGGGRALDLFNARSGEPPAGANLCSSSCDLHAVTPEQMQRLTEIMLHGGGDLFQLRAHSGT